VDVTPPGTPAVPAETVADGHATAGVVAEVG
jgi:hypothetical protein